MAGELNNKQRLAKSNSYKKNEKQQEESIDYEYNNEETSDLSNPLVEQVMALYGEEYDYSSLTKNELNMFLQYALSAYRNQDFSALHPDNLPIDLKIKLNSLPIIEVEESKKSKEKIKSTKKEKEYNWNKKFDVPTNKYDSQNIIIEADINGCSDDAKKFIEKLFGCYVLLAEKHKFRVELLESSDKKFSILVNGEEAYKTFKFEKGLHYIKDKEFNSNIFISILPQIDQEKSEIKINPNDLKIDTYRSGGAGGQHVNKTSTAIRITHLPTGIVVTCQEERSQLQNRNQAMKILHAKLVELEEQKKTQNEINIRLEGLETSKIRTYDLNNNTLTDHRIGLKIGIEQGIEKFDLEKVIEKLSDICDKFLENIEKSNER